MRFLHAMARARLRNLCYRFFLAFLVQGTYLPEDFCRQKCVPMEYLPRYIVVIYVVNINIEYLAG